jgi:hypothetical protein
MIEFTKRAFPAQQLRQPLALRRIGVLRQRQLAHNQIQRIGADAQLECGGPRNLRSNLLAQECRNRVEQLSRRRFVLHDRPRLFP